MLWSAKGPIEDFAILLMPMISSQEPSAPTETVRTLHSCPDVSSSDFSGRSVETKSINSSYNGRKGQLMAKIHSAIRYFFVFLIWEVYEIKAI